MTVRPFDPIAALTFAHEYAREHITEPLETWRPFVATEQNGHQVFGLWRLIEPGLQALLLSVMPSHERPEFVHVTRPTGIRVIDNAFVGTRKVRGRTFFTESVGVLARDNVSLTDPACRYAMHAHLEPCTVLVVRGMPFLPRREEREVPVRIATLERTQAEALHRKMQRLLAG